MLRPELQHIGHGHLSTFNGLPHFGIEMTQNGYYPLKNGNECIIKEVVHRRKKNRFLAFKRLFQSNLHENYLGV